MLSASTAAAARRSLLAGAGARASTTSTTSRTSLAAVPTCLLSPRRTMVTKEERWTHETAASAQSLLSPSSGAGAGAGGSASGIELKSILPNIEARWKQMPKEEQYAVFRLLEEVQKKDWKELSLDEKKAAYFISFGPHGPRKPLTVPGQAIKTFGGVTALVAATFVVFYGVRHAFANPNAPKTLTKEYQEAMTERAREEKQNPITGIASEGYKGKGHVQ